MEHFVGTGSDAKVVGEIDPTDCTGGVDEELRRTCYVVAFDAGTFVKKIIAADDFGVRIREKREGVAGLPAEVLGLGGRIDTDGYGLDA